MNHKYACGSLLLSCLCSIAWAQEEPASDAYRHDIGFNTTFILQGIFNSNQTPFSIMYKKVVDNHKATRFGFNIQLNVDSNSPEGTNTSYIDESNGYFAFSFGKELQQPIGSSKWIWYYGGDFEPFYQFDNIDHYADSQTYLTSRYHRYGLDVRPFLGIRFDINDRLYLTAEASAILRYAQTSNFINYTNDQEPALDVNGHNLSFSMQAANGIFMFYRF
jgi:hypothetical protein